LEDLGLGWGDYRNCMWNQWDVKGAVTSDSG